jgi:bifunctional enzyme CysN/CysC
MNGMAIVIVGHVDHGKSTVVGRLLADTHSLPDGKLEAVRQMCERTSKPFEYAFLLDALKDEQAQGITIDAARVFFKTARRPYLIIDAPGHIEFLKNMVTGASRAEAALLVIDAKEGVQENSRRHGYMLSLLGIRQVAVVVNKMDLVDYSRSVFEAVRSEFQAFLAEVGIRPAGFIPASGRLGDTIAHRTAAMPWYAGPTVVEALDGFETEPLPVDKPFRMPVQDVYKFTKQGDDRRIIAGTIESGVLAVGDEVVFFPSGKRSRVKTIEAFNPVATEPAGGSSGGDPRPRTASAGAATGFTLHEQIYVTRGEVATVAAQARPHVTTRLRVSVFWLGRQALVKKRDYVLKLGTARALVHLDEIHRVLDASTLRASDQKTRIERHDVAECVLKTNRAIAFDLSHEIAATGRFVLVDDFEICGGGIVQEALPDTQAWVRDKVILRNYKWEPSHISLDRRAERYNQKATLLLVTGGTGIDRKTLAKDLEARLFQEGKIVYFLGIGNVLYGVDADIERKQENRREHIRRLSEVANLMLDAGVILIVTAAELGQDDLELIKTTVDQQRIETVWIGDEVTTDIEVDLQLPEHVPGDDAIDQIKSLLQQKGVIFQPW